MIRFAEVFPDETNVSTLWRQLGWSHFKEIIYQKDELQRNFYAEMCRVERWSVRTPRQKIDSIYIGESYFDYLAALPDLVPFKNVFFDYPLGKVMTDGFVREPAVVTRKNFNPAGMAPEEIERLKLEDGLRLPMANGPG